MVSAALSASSSAVPSYERADAGHVSGFRRQDWPNRRSGGVGGGGGGSMMSQKIPRAAMFFFKGLSVVLGQLSEFLECSCTTMFSLLI